MSETLRSVGIDIGTTTTQLVFSDLTVQNEGAAFSVPNYAITDKRVVYRSAAHFTPLRSETEIDADGVRSIVAREYEAAGVARGDVQTGAVIITGETARKENARQVLDALAGFAGDFVVATAGPALESVLAGKGAGAASLSEREHCAVLNLDIGGGTTNFALFDCGALCDTGCINVGGRLMKLDADGTVRYVSPVLAPYFSFPLGSRVTPESLWPVISLLTRLLEEAAGLRPRSERLAHFITDRLPQWPDGVVLSFSGGVAELMERAPDDLFAFGDLGVLLGRAIRESRLCAGRWRLGEQRLRATVIGAGSYTTELSGSTIFCDGAAFPLKNLPVAALSRADESLEPAALAQRVQTALAPYAGQEAVVALHGPRSPGYAQLSRLADGLAGGLTNVPFPIVAVREDMGKALGQALGARLHRPLVCLDGVLLPEGSYLDIGAPVAGGAALPVVVKTILL